MGCALDIAVFKQPGRFRFFHAEPDNYAMDRRLSGSFVCPLESAVGEADADALSHHP